MFNDACGCKCSWQCIGLRMSPLHSNTLALCICGTKESCFPFLSFPVQVLLEASDIAGISLFLLMVIACTVAIILLPVETKGKSLRVSLHWEGLHGPHLYISVSALHYMLEIITTLFAFYASHAGDWKHAVQEGCTWVLPSPSHCV